MTRNEFLKILRQFIDTRSPDGSVWNIEFTNNGAIDSKKPPTGTGLPYTLPFTFSGAPYSSPPNSVLPYTLPFNLTP